MKKYQIYEVQDKNNTAGSKALDDIADISSELGYKKLIVQINTSRSLLQKIFKQFNYFHQYWNIYKSVEFNSVILLQNPLRIKQLGRTFFLSQLKKKKNVKYICVIHDIEILRNSLYNDYYKFEFNSMKKIHDAIICHNQVMKNYLIQHGFDEKKVFVIEIFDYLQENIKKSLEFNNTLNIAGNLDIDKTGYLNYLPQLNFLKINLFGPNYDNRLSSFYNIHYHGSFSSTELSPHLLEGFGLVWDGNDLTECNGNYGNYLKYNNPHKLSLYLASNMPVVIWNKAAEAEFVKKHNVGICVDSLLDLKKIFNNLDSTSYEIYINNARKVGKKLREGFYTKKALHSVEQYLLRI